VKTQLSTTTLILLYDSTHKLLRTESGNNDRVELSQSPAVLL